MFAPVFVELLFGFAGEGALRAGVGALSTVVHDMLLQLNRWTVETLCN
jgi:hypothetical protein